MANDTATTNTIPQRSDMETKYTWNLTDIYKDDAAWEADYARGKEIIASASKYAGRLADSAKTLFECLETRTEIGRIGSNLYQYAYLNKDLDNRVSKYQAMTERAAMLGSEAGAAFSFVEPELLAIDESKLLAMEKQFPKDGHYDFYLKDLIRSKAHVRSSEVEELLAQSGMMARGSDSIFSMLDDADLTFPSITDESGNEIKLTRQRYAKLLESNSQRVRRDASDAFHTSYKAHINTIGATLSSSINKDLFYTKARRYETCLDRALDGGNIPLSVYHSLLETTEANLAGLHKYVEVRKRILKLEHIYPFDMYCPLFPEQNVTTPYDDAVRKTLDAVKPLGETYHGALKKGFETRWVDVFETEGKGGGAYNWGNYDSHPFVLMNYNDTIDNMFTLAHEMGHAMHSHLANTHQPRPKAQYSIFVAEVASTLNEGLLLEYLLKQTDDKRAKLDLLNRYLDNTMGTFFHQVLYARFELEMHKIVEDGGALSPEVLSEMWEKFTHQFYGPAMTLDDHAKLKWSRIPHFYNMYYVYQYATSYAASQAILAKFLAGEKGIIEKYLAMLSDGGADYPVEQLKRCGIDMASPEPVLATLKLFSAKVDEMDRLTRE